MRLRCRSSWLVVLCCGCPSTDRDEQALGNGTGTGEGDGSISDGGPGADGPEGSDGLRLDVSPSDGESGDPAPSCKVTEEGSGVGMCDQVAPPDSFQPVIEWSWTGPDGESASVVTPLVANLTDDDGNGTIDLCDVPDVVVVASEHSLAEEAAGHIYVLDGATGALHFRIEAAVDHSTTPAIGDIDDDGQPEIVAALVDGPGRLAAFDHDGSLLWTASEPWAGSYCSAIGLADFDNDGDVEIYTGEFLADHQGARIFTVTAGVGPWSAPTAADLDGDGDLELVVGGAAFHHDGTPVFVSTELDEGLFDFGYPQVADFDDDPEPEILVVTPSGLAMLEHDGAVVYNQLRPTGDPIVDISAWMRPAVVHDFDGDGRAEYATSSMNHYTVYEADGSIAWSSTISDLSGIAGGTAFDFLGDGVAEAMYADEHNMFVFDGVGDVYLQIERSSNTGIEYPVVADVDNDGSAEILVVANYIPTILDQSAPTIQVIGDVDDRWIQARRIWNQHAYHVTNVREDGTIPQFEAPSWANLNTFRSNAQIENGGVCQPPPPG